METDEPNSLQDPPDDPEEWTDEQWVAWLKATDEETPAEGADLFGRAPGRISRSSGAHVLGQAMIGIANALYGQQDNKVVIAAPKDSDPEDDEPGSFHIDPDHPEDSYYVVDGEPNTESGLSADLSEPAGTGESD